MYEIYLSDDKKPKTYIVSTDAKVKEEELKDYARRYFHVGLDRIYTGRGWILNDELWLENPKKKGQKICWIANTKPKG